MKEIIVISDFIEGQPVVASVRYSELMEFISKKYSAVVINNECNGEFKSKFGSINFKFKTTLSKFTRSLNNRKVKLSCIERALRNRFILSIWRNYSCSRYKFIKQNKKLLKTLEVYIKNNNIYAVFITVPDISGIYLAQYIKNLNRKIYLIFEIRDILNNSIGKGNPKFVIKKAENILTSIADGIITLSEGIYNYYRKFDGTEKMEIIRNGYSEYDFMECEYKHIYNEAKLKFVHIGSIYKGRNLRDFVFALIKLGDLLEREIQFDVVGYLDDDAIKDVEYLIDDLGKSKVSVNILGALSHEECIRYLKTCDIAVILTHKKGSEYAIPGKAFEYIGACKPIIAVTVDKELIELVNNKYGECADHNQMDILEKILKILKSNYSFYDRFQFSRENQAKKIISFIERICEEKENKI